MPRAIGPARYGVVPDGCNGPELRRTKMNSYSRYTVCTVPGKWIKLAFRPTCIAACLVPVGLVVAALACRADSVTSMHSFVGPPEGTLPTSRLVQATDGSFYGTSSSGGPYDCGTVYMVSPGG